MKKSLLVLLIIILLSGCTVVRIDEYNYEQVIDKILSLNIKTYNTIGKGYKYYIPKKVTRVQALDYNDVLKRGNDTYYLYVDVVSYYYKSKLNYDKNGKFYFYKELNNGKKQGYVQIINKNDKLFVQMVYNYAKIEAYVDEDDLKDSLIDFSYILSSIKFNDSLLKKMYESGNLDAKDEVYKLFENKSKEGNFLEYIKEYDKYDDSKEEIKEEQIIIEEQAQQDVTTSN